jgi:orotidine 5'-phosphate decarboxylase subfamily 2
VTSFLQTFSDYSNEKNSVLCVGLDPALPKQRADNVIPAKYLTSADENEARLNFCLDIVEQVNEFSVAAKPNQQYVFGFTKNQHQKLTAAIRKSKMISILDYKLNDIRDTVESSIFHLSECGYDAITFNPFMGNIAETVKLAHDSVRRVRDRELGIIVLTLTSNPEACKYMKQATLHNKPLFVSIAHDVEIAAADGAVVGATGHVTEDDIRVIRKIVGEERVLLIPGIGAQHGDHEKIIRVGGRRILINVGRDVIYSNSPKKTAEKYAELFNDARRRYQSIL